MKAVILLLCVAGSSAQYLFGNNPLWNAGAVHHDPLWNLRSAGPVGYYQRDTPEVEAAKAQHFAAHAEARARGKRSADPGHVEYGYSTAVVHRAPAAIAYSTPVVHAAPVAYSGIGYAAPYGARVFY